MIAATTLPIWVPFLVFCLFAAYSFYGILNAGPMSEKALRERERSPKVMQALFSFFTFGQWRKPAVMKAWTFWGAVSCLVGSLIILGSLIFAAYETSR